MFKAPALGSIPPVEPIPALEPIPAARIHLKRSGLRSQNRPQKESKSYSDHTLEPIIPGPESKQPPLPFMRNLRSRLKDMTDRSRRTPNNPSLGRVKQPRTPLQSLEENFGQANFGDQTDGSLLPLSIPDSACPPASAQSPK